MTEATPSDNSVVIITGGGGFLGRCLCTALLSRGGISKLVLADIAFNEALPTESSSADIVKLTGDVSDRPFCDKIYAEAQNASSVSVFHLGSVMSGDGERDFDLCLRVNLHGFLYMIEGARRHVYESLGFCAKFIFASSGFIVGTGAPTDYVSSQDTISDACRATPHTTYGATKACCELLLSDYARRGFVDARGLRLPTIVVRAGAPNAATTGCFSAIVREPLSGLDVTVPISRDVRHAVTGKRAAISAMIHIHDVPKNTIEEVLGYDRTVFIPAVALSLGDLEDALIRVTGSHADKLGKIVYKVDEQLNVIVASFPTKVDAGRALRLGLLPAPDAETLVREYMADFPNAVASGIEAVSQK